MHPGSELVVEQVQLELMQAFVTEYVRTSATATEPQLAWFSVEQMGPQNWLTEHLHHNEQVGHELQY